MKGYSLFLLLPLLLPSVVAKADLSQPCFNGVCSFDVEQSPTSMGGTVVLSGSPNAISDITPAAGWEVLNCSSSAASQTIRLVCTGDSASCNHLFNNGPENTIVRLPSNCGRGPFAVIEKATVSTDQSMPQSLIAGTVKRAANPPQVQELSINTNLSKVTSSPHGEVAFAVVGTNIPGALQNISLGPELDVNKTIRIFQDLTIGSFNFNKSTTLSPINAGDTLTLVNENVNCGSFSGSLDVTAALSLNVDVTLGIAASGSVIPARLNEFALFADLGAAFNGDLNVAASLLGTFDTGVVTLATVSIPGFAIAGIIDVGPSLDLDARAQVGLDIAAELSYSLPISIPNVQLIFPPSQGSSSASITAGPSTFQIQTLPDSPADTSLQIDLIPTLNVALDVISIASASVSLNVDADVTLDLSFEAGASVTSGNVNSEFKGCFEVGGGVSVNAGAEGSLAGLFSDDAEFTIFSKTFNLFEKCFSGSNSRAKRSDNLMRELPGKPLLKRGLSCPSSSSLASLALLDAESALGLWCV